MRRLIVCIFLYLVLKVGAFGDANPNFSVTNYSGQAWYFEVHSSGSTAGPVQLDVGGYTNFAMSGGVSDIMWGAYDTSQYASNGSWDQDFSIEFDGTGEDGEGFIIGTYDPPYVDRSDNAYFWAGFSAMLVWMGFALKIRAIRGIARATPYGGSGD